MFNIGPLELIVVALVALLVVGPKRLPELGKTIGKGLREFRKAQDELRRSVDLTLDEPRPSFEERGPRPSRRPASRTTNDETDDDETAVPANASPSDAEADDDGDDATDAEPPIEPQATGSTRDDRSA